MPEEPLTNNERRILNLLKERNYSFNELCKALKNYMSPPTVRNTLDHLIGMQLVHEAKGRRGQKTTYTLTETLNRFEEKAKCLEMMWDDQFSKLGQLEKYVEYDFINREEVGSLLVWLIYEAVPLLASGLVESQLSLEAKEKLLSFSSDRFCSCWEEILRLGEKYSEIRQGFQKGCKELATHTKPIEERIENKFEHLAKLKHKHLSKQS